MNARVPPIPLEHRHRVGGRSVGWYSFVGPNGPEDMPELVRHGAATTDLPHIVFDISRLLLRVGHAVPTGIDRVELAYAEHLLTHAAKRTSFVLGLPVGSWGRVPGRHAAALISALAARWRNTGYAGRAPGRILLRLIVAALLDAARRAGGMARPPAGPAVYLNVSHQHLDRPRIIRSILRWSDARLVVLLHDLIPISFPEYGRPGQADRHLRRIATAMRLADGILVNSASTRDCLVRHVPDCQAPVLVVPLGVEPGGSAGEPQQVIATSPYFVCIGTIEPRKNHLMLLHLWRHLAEDGSAVPHLYVIGRRGWENEMVVDLLERCPAINGVVHERNGLPDTEVRALLRGARALLMPSFAEGYGLPLAEALAEGAPVVCSDLPAHREIGGDVPEYLDPLDGVAWLQAVRDYALPGSARRHAQMTRLENWQPPCWKTHMMAAIGFVDGMASEASKASGAALDPPGGSGPLDPIL